MTEQKVIVDKKIIDNLVEKANIEPTGNTNEWNTTNPAWVDGYSEGMRQAVGAIMIPVYLAENSVQQTFEVGEYYVAEVQGIYKIGDYNQNRELYTVDCFDQKKKIFGKAYVWHKEYFGKDRPATVEEIALFKRAEHFHSKGRKLNEFKHGDIVNNLRTDGYVTYTSKNRQVMHICFSHTDIQVEYTPETFDQLTLIMTSEELEAAAMEVEE